MANKITKEKKPDKYFYNKLDGELIIYNEENDCFVVVKEKESFNIDDIKFPLSW